MGPTVRGGPGASTVAEPAPEHKHVPYLYLRAIFLYKIKSLPHPLYITHCFTHMWGSVSTCQ